MTLAPIKGQCPVCRQGAGLNLDPVVPFSESKQLAELRAENDSLKEVISLSEDSRLMDEYLKLERANARQAERIKANEQYEQALKDDCRKQVADLRAAIAAQSAVIEQAKTAMDSAKETEGWDEVPYRLHVKLDALFDALNALPEGADQWQPIETAPKTGRTILLGYKNALGNWRTLRGQYFNRSTIDEYWENPDECDEGWYETSVEADDIPNCWATNPTHWMPLPKPPAVAEKKGGV